MKHLVPRCKQSLYTASRINIIFEIREDWSLFTKKKRKAKKLTKIFSDPN